MAREERPIWYEPHPVSPERKAEILAKGYRIIDAQFGKATEPPKVVGDFPPLRQLKSRRKGMPSVALCIGGAATATADAEAAI